VTQSSSEVRDDHRISPLTVEDSRVSIHPGGLVRNQLSQSSPIVGDPLAASSASEASVMDSGAGLVAPRGVDRRAVVAGAGLVCVLGVLSACGSSPAPSAAGKGPADDGVDGSDNSVVAPSSSSSGAAGALTAVADVPVGGGVVVNDVLVVQPTAGTLKAFDAHCVHKGAIVKAPDATGAVVCPAHGASYSAVDGSLVKGPATRGLDAIPVKVVNGKVLRA
jgi:nitrite reductase/ring-hydroxylating ferredoxin subunit